MAVDSCKVGGGVTVGCGPYRLNGRQTPRPICPLTRCKKIDMTHIYILPVFGKVQSDLRILTKILWNS